MKKAIIISFAGVFTLALAWAGLKLFQNSYNPKYNIVDKNIEIQEKPIEKSNSVSIVDSSTEKLKKKSNIVNPEKQPQKTSELTLKFLDVMTGYSIIPSSIEVRQRENKEVFNKITEREVTANGTVNIPLVNGTYDITVMANGYSPMTSFFQLHNQSLNVNFNLEPLVPIKELTSEFIQSLHRNDAMVIVGFIVDDFSGKPLSGVNIFSNDNIMNTTSQSNGFFKLILPLPESENSVSDRNKLLFEKSDYITESRKNFDMYPQGDIILQIRMKKGKGENSEDILTNRKASVTILNK